MFVAQLNCEIYPNIPKHFFCKPGVAFEIRVRFPTLSTFLFRDEFLNKIFDQNVSFYFELFET